MGGLYDAILNEEKKKIVSEDPFYVGSIQAQKQQVPYNPNYGAKNNLAAGLIKGLGAGLLGGIGEITTQSKLTGAGDELRRVFAQASGPNRTQQKLEGAMRASDRFKSYAGDVAADFRDREESLGDFIAKSEYQRRARDKDLSPAARSGLQKLLQNQANALDPSYSKQRLGPEEWADVTRNTTTANLAKGAIGGEAISRRQTERLDIRKAQLELSSYDWMKGPGKLPTPTIATELQRKKAAYGETVRKLNDWAAMKDGKSFFDDFGQDSAMTVAIQSHLMNLGRLRTNSGANFTEKEMEFIQALTPASLTSGTFAALGRKVFGRDQVQFTRTLAKMFDTDFDYAMMDTYGVARGDKTLDYYPEELIRKHSWEVPAYHQYIEAKKSTDPEGEVDTEAMFEGMSEAELRRIANGG